MAIKEFFISILVISVTVGLASAECYGRDRCSNRGCHRHGGCHCDPGYGGSTCQHRDHCHGIHCSDHGTCSSHSSSFTCNCHQGYTGTYCDDNACHNEHCSGNGKCSPTTSAPYWTCDCDNGYIGDSCQNNLCLNEHCSGNGKCSLTTSAPYWTCACDNGYTGETCQNNPCQNEHCSGNGVCSLTTSAPYWTCTCDNGYTGETCQNNLCQNEQCSGNGKCSLTTSAPYWTCACDNGYAGETCQNPSFRNCSDVDVVSGIVMQTYSTNNDATSCSTGNTNSPEAFVLNSCNVSQQTTSWHKGVQVMSSVNCSSATPMYTPVAMFTGIQYSPSSQDNVAGVFVGCLPGGFKLAVQQCGQPPKIVHIDSTSTVDPNMFYTIT